jgi:hypothetical protein
MLQISVPSKGTVVATIAAVLPKSTPAVSAALWALFSGLAPVTAAVRIPGTGKSGTAMVRVLLAAGDPRATRHAVPLLSTYVGTYGPESADDERLRSRAGMAISKVAKSLREQGYPVGVANVATDSGILSVPFVTDPTAPDPRD